MPERKADKPLSRDVRDAGRLLAEALAEQDGEEVLALEERVRSLAVQRRRGPKPARADAARRLVELLARLPIEHAEPIIRAFAVYFQLVNVAEQVHRIRRARAHAEQAAKGEGGSQRGSLADVLSRAKKAGVSAEAARQAIAELRVVLTFTAHPTQAVRRTVLEKLYRVSRVLHERDRCRLTPQEAERSTLSMREEITQLLQTDEVRRERPQVADEVKNITWYVEEIIYECYPALADSFERAFEESYGEKLGFHPTPVRVHSWAGGDMDGNPLVTPEVVEDAIRAYHARGLRKLIWELRRLGSSLSQSDRRVKVPQRLLASLEEDERRMPWLAEKLGPRSRGEPWRRKLTFLTARLSSTLAEVEQGRPVHFSPEGVLPHVRVPEPHRTAITAGELEREMVLVADTLREAKGAHAGERAARALLDRIRAFGEHIAELEIRAPAEDALSAARALAGEGELSPGGKRLVEALRRIRTAQLTGGERACRTLILSMTTKPEEVLAALQCARAAGLWSEEKGCASLDIAPLFETPEALEQAPGIMARLFEDAEYRRHLAGRKGQEVMVGYSDSGKEVGLLAANALLRRAQLDILETARAAGVDLWFFHGRGETVARGGGPSQGAILALPKGSVAGLLKVTEQGEALDHKYALPELALRTLELTVGGALLHTLGAAEGPGPEEEARYEQVFAELADEGRRVFRALVWEDPQFEAFYRAATPVDEIAEMNIGSRPAKRAAGGLKALRAIPWVFAWTQSRAIVPGWYGVGSALAKIGTRPGGQKLLAEMYKRWPFFRSVIDGVEMVLAKADLEIASRYAQLAAPELRQAVWTRIEAEFERTEKWVRKVNGHRRLLDGNKPLQRSIDVRNPFVDPMSFLQIELLKRRRAGDPQATAPLLLTVGGIAAGLRNTG